jgi:hypothetical protein
MPSVEERVAYLEGRTEEHSTMIAEVRSDIRELRAEMIRRFEQTDRRFEQRFTWLIGLQFATLLAVIAAVLG